MKLKLKYFNKSQLAIFILIILMIIILFVFLISTNFDNKIEKIDSNKNKLTQDMDSKILSIKDTVDFCLKKELRTAAILSGSRGGYIFSRENEFYFPGVNYYNYSFLRNQEINSNDIYQRVLIYKNLNRTYFPELDNITSGSAYNHTIKEDFERYILDGFLTCLNLDEIKLRG